MRDRAFDVVFVGRGSAEAILANRLRNGAQVPRNAGVYDHLRAIKRKYDPTNMFRVNHNIPPLPDA